MAGFALRRVASDSICVQNDSTSLLVWMPIGDSSARKAMQEFSRDLRRDLGSTPLIAASDQCNDESDYTSAIKACQRTVALADRFGRSGLLSEEDFGPHALVLASMPQKDIEPFVRRTLGPLEDAGAQSGAHLVPTVEAFLRSGCRLQKCADTIGIHITTLRYRLDRVHELCGIDFEDADTRFALDLAFRFRQARVPTIESPEEVSMR
jgi:DNA-binding PucR family transcriptional regulator